MAVTLRHAGILRRPLAPFSRLHYKDLPALFLLPSFITPPLIRPKPGNCSHFAQSSETSLHSASFGSQCMVSALSPALCFGWPEWKTPDWVAPASLQARSVSSSSRSRRRSASKCTADAPVTLSEYSQASRDASGGSHQLRSSADYIQETSSKGSSNDKPTFLTFLDDEPRWGEEDEIVSGWDYDSNDPDIRVLARGSSDFNSKIEVVELQRTADHPLAGATLLLLDTANNIHSVYFK